MIADEGATRVNYTAQKSRANNLIVLVQVYLVPIRCARDLGVIFDDQFTVSEHTVKTVSSCMSSLTQINRAKHAFDKDLFVTIIKGLVFCKMFYCSSIWSNTSLNNINKLHVQTIQNFAARIVTRSRKFDHITPILKQLRRLDAS